MDRSVAVLALALAISPAWAQAPAPGPAAQAAPAAGPAAPGSSARGPAIIELDRVVAVVNSDVITASELAARERATERQLRRQRIELPAADVLSRQVLERMVVDRALVQAAREQGVRIDDAQIDRAFGRMAESNSITPAELRARIEADGVSYQRFRDELRDDLAIARLREREVDSRIFISEADVDAFIAEQRASDSSPGQYNIAQILLRIPEGASSERIERERLRAEEILRQLERGADFARLAAAFSDATDALNGGAIGMRDADRLPQLFVQAVADLQPGQIAPIVRSANGFHVLKLLERNKGGLAGLATDPVTQTHARHILIRPSEILPEAEVLRRLVLVKQRVENREVEFADMARQYSVDGSASRGGDLGWIYPGDTVGAFERAMDALAPGAVSEPVRTEFGYHLIQVIERRTDTASPERVRAAARQALRERRIEEGVQDWIRQVRDRAYVEYREK
ncbi:MAG: peptidylprolyl isomerase [Burkholderiaceae bacterium]|nr:peptidylprolyl isomerase [Burkholderiaceae bacterium]